ncbi:MAG: hypothetical protein JXK94_10365 [Deltaproteobacteria bacterium]|nr:hypothetical protein [Deltaproteobacteria bacterium]
MANFSSNGNFLSRWKNYPQAGGLPSEVKDKVNWGRVAIEVLLYFSLVSRIFGHQLGVLRIPQLSGAMIVGAAVACVVIMISQREPFPVTLVFAVLINFIANVHDFYFIEKFTRQLTYWVCFLLMACYIVRDRRAAFRFACFLGGAVLLSVVMGATFVGIEEGQVRLALEGDVAGSMFANPNALAQVAYVTATALLFISLRAKLLSRLVCWVMALSLGAVVLLTLSRQGLFLLALGVFFFLLASLKGWKGKLGLVVFVVLIGASTVIFSDQVADIVRGYEYRLNLESGRLFFWETAFHDMKETLIAGKGYFGGYTSTGFKPHNTFLWLHLAYGGICAWLYVSWLGYLIFKTWDKVRSKNVAWEVKMEMLAFLSLFLFGQIVTIFAPGNLGYILGVALLEKRMIPHDKLEIPAHSSLEPQGTV